MTFAEVENVVSSLHKNTHWDAMIIQEFMELMKINLGRTKIIHFLGPKDMEIKGGAL